MHLIEQWFGFSPDGGSGATELLYGIALAGAVLLVIGGARLLSARRDRAR